MRELDDLLLRWLERRYEAADEVDKSAFRELLMLSDPQLFAYFLKREEPQSGSIATVVRQILERDSA